MQRLGAIFIAVCMVAISTSVGAMLYFRFGLSIPEASPVAFGILLTLLLVHYQISRVRDRMMIEEQMDDLTRLKLTLTKEVQDVRELAHRLESDLDERVNRDIEPVLAELDIIGSLVKQLAESCAELDERVQEGDSKVEAINATVQSAKHSVQELESLLRSSVRAMPQQSEQAASFSEGPASHPRPSQPSAHDMGTAPYGYPEDQMPEPEEEIIRPEDEAAVRRALALGQIEMFMQPIVTLPMRKPQYYEALARLRSEDGSLLTPDIFLPVCRKNGFLPMLDRLAINETFRMQRRLADRGHMVDCFCNLALASLADGDFFAQLRGLFEQNRDLAEHVILEFSLADMNAFGVLEDETLQLLRSMGFRFSVDQMTTLNADFDKFARKGVRFAKIAAPILTSRDVGHGLDIHPADFSRVLARKGIDLVVTHVETESMLVGLIDFNVQLAQGNHFAPAKAVKGAGSGGDGGTSDNRSQAVGARVGDSPPVRVHGQRNDAQRGEGPRGAGQVNERLTNGAVAQPQALQAQQAPMPTPDSEASQRRLGDNPRVAQALRAMAKREGGQNSSTRDHFRNVLAEAAGLMDDGPARSGQSLPGAANGQRASAAPDRLPVSDDYGVKTSTDRGQFLDLGNQPARDQQTRDTRPDASGGGAGFERLIR
ncbi:EAL domain-containing protein [Cohaesibacter intestini]|uniref:EAL domain-containing protein n=1 Tax=Cohaesibacter intestini TaxID=2211145 RepID=UPI001300263B|nr:EAL domain-containing protein [Cohaesibacter intestini]